MEWICKLIEPPQEQQEGNNLTYQLITDNESINNNQETTEEVVSWTFLDYSRHVFVPLLCIIGILGNLLNMSILGKRIKEGKHLHLSLSNAGIGLEYFNVWLYGKCFT